VPPEGKVGALREGRAEAVHRALLEAGLAQRAGQAGIHRVQPYGVRQSAKTRAAGSSEHGPRGAGAEPGGA
jgi:hypothetical protein